MKVVIFEDIGVRWLYPLTLTHPAWELLWGMSTLVERIRRAFTDDQIILHTRSYLVDVLREKYNLPVNMVPDDTTLFVNGRLMEILSPDIIPTSTEEQLLLNDAGDPIFAIVSQKNLTHLHDKLSHGDEFTVDDFNFIHTRRQVKLKLAHYLWDYVLSNATAITKEFELIKPTLPQATDTTYEGVYLINADSIYIHPTAKLAPCVVLDATNGPILIDRDAVVMPHTAIEGPTYIGPGSKIKIGTKIYEGTSIGPVCKIGGEVDNSIVLGYSNKQHDGFLGHAYIGEWINLGAGTSNSDLKNNYSSVKVYLHGEEIDTGHIFIGLMMGDHSKTAINTTLNTGTVVGVSANLFGEGFPPKYVPSFAWGGAKGFTEYKLDKAIATARKVMARRDKELTTSYERMLRYIFDLTRTERVSFS